MKLFQIHRATPPAVSELMDRIALVCDQLAAQYNLQAPSSAVRLVIERQKEKTQQRILIANSLFALSFVANKQALKAHLFPANQLVAKGEPESAINQRLYIRLKASAEGSKLLLDDSTDVAEQLDLLVLSLFEELVRRSQAAAQSGTRGRVALDGTSMMTAVRNLVHENQSLISQLLQQNEQIHNHIAADIHDQVLSDLLLLKKTIGKRSDNEQELQLLEDAMGYLRDICSGLSSKDLQTFGLMPCLKNLVTKMRRHSELEIEFMQTGSLPTFPEQVSLQIFRIIQEALNNANKHANGTRITVTISGGAEHCAFRVSDDGQGLPESRSGSGLGLSILAERDALIQQFCRSRLSVTPNEPQGVAVLLEVWPTELK